MAAAAPATSLPASETDPLPQQYFGVNPRQLLEDVYNAADDLACDGLDEVERVLLNTFAGSGKSTGGAAASAGGSSVTAAAAAASSSASAEIRTGTDKLVEAVLDGHVRPGDKLEVYCLMELFGLHGELREEVEALITERGDRAQVAPGAHVPSEAELASLDADVAKLEQAAKRQRRRARTLMRLLNLYARRVPEAEEADARLGELLTELSRRSAGAWEQTLAHSANFSGSFLALFSEMCSNLHCHSSLRSTPYATISLVPIPPQMAKSLTMRCPPSCARRNTCRSCADELLLLRQQALRPPRRQPALLRAATSLRPVLQEKSATSFRPFLETRTRLKLLETRLPHLLLEAQLPQSRKLRKWPHKQAPANGL